MQSTVLLLLTTVVAVALAGGQFYVPRAYYTIDAEGHASAPVPLRRLRRSLAPVYGTHRGYGHGGNFGGADANANANADAYSSWGVSSANANANANAHASATRSNGYGGWALPSNGYGSANPNALKAGQTKFQYGPVVGGRSISASSSVGIDHTGRGYYEQKASSA